MEQEYLTSDFFGGTPILPSLPLAGHYCREGGPDGRCHQPNPNHSGTVPILGLRTYAHRSPGGGGDIGAGVLREHPLQEPQLLLDMGVGDAYKGDPKSDQQHCQYSTGDGLRVPIHS